jgi:RNA polymerase sigma-70 factor (ECF subfamily)
VIDDSRPPPADDPVDRALRARVAAGDLEHATESALRRYGPELLGWLRDTLPAADADDAFSHLSVELWRSLGRYHGGCSIRTWCYMLARHAAAWIRSRPSRSREVLVSQIPSVVAAVAYVSDTTVRRDLEAGDRYAELRRTLDDDDQTLLVLRVDRELPWRDIAQVMLGEDATIDDLVRHAAQLRKRFERIKARLRELALERAY